MKLKTACPFVCVRTTHSKLFYNTILQETTNLKQLQQHMSVCLSFKYGDAQFKTGGSPRENAWRVSNTPWSYCWQFAERERVEVSNTSPARTAGCSPRGSAWRCLTLPGRTAGGSPLQQTAPHSQAVSCGDSILPATGDERPFVLPTDHHLPLSAGPYPPVHRALWQAVIQGFNPFRTPGLFPFDQGQAPAAWWAPCYRIPVQSHRRPFEASDFGPTGLSLCWLALALSSVALPDPHL